MRKSGRKIIIIGKKTAFVNNILTKAIHNIFKFFSLAISKKCPPPSTFYGAEPPKSAPIFFQTHLVNPEIACYTPAGVLPIKK